MPRALPLLALLALITLPAASSHEAHRLRCEEDGGTYACNGTLFVGIAGQKVEGPAEARGALDADGLSAVAVEVPARVAGAPFTLAALGGSSGAFGRPDFDVTFRDAEGVELAVFEAIGPESGRVPAGTADALVVLFDGRSASFDFRVEG